MNKEILDKAEVFVVDTFTEKLAKRITYHNIIHTKYVVEHVNKLADLSGVSPHEKHLLNLAAWFHDLGYIETEAGHEMKSADYAAQFMQENGFDETDIEAVRKLILCTQMDIKPTSLSEQIMRDADVSHLGSEIYFEKSEMLKKEWEKIEAKTIDEKVWLTKNIDFFNKHEYFTEAAKELFDVQKQKNLTQIMDKLNSLPDSDKPAKKNKGKKKGDGKGKDNGKKRPDRGIETMFRTTLKNHIQLSQIADNKANIMLSINAIIVSIVLTSLFPKLDKHPYLIWPSVILLVVCILSIVLATISTIPKVTKVKTDRASIESKSANLLFFGNFHDMEFSDFKWGMSKVMEDEEYLYGSMIKDLYYLGKVLYKKYKYLRWCYAVFMTGIIISVLAYLISTSMAFQSVAS